MNKPSKKLKDLIEDIKIRAQQIREEWKQE